MILSNGLRFLLRLVINAIQMGLSFYWLTWVTYIIVNILKPLQWTSLLFLNIFTILFIFVLHLLIFTWILNFLLLFFIFVYFFFLHFFLLFLINNSVTLFFLLWLWNLLLCFIIAFMNERVDMFFTFMSMLELMFMLMEQLNLIKRIKLGLRLKEANHMHTSTAPYHKLSMLADFHKKIQSNLRTFLV